MDETKYVCGPNEPTKEQYAAGIAAFHKPANQHGAVLDEVYKAMLAAAPTTHVAVKRELLERVAAHCKVMYRAPDDAENFERHSIEAELRALLSQKGE